MARVGAASEVFRIAGQQTIEATRKLLIRTAKAKNTEVMNRDPRPAMFTRYVDGKQGAPEEAVEATGTIIYRYPRLELVAQYAMEVLFDLSPVLSGDYRNSHTLFLNGVPASNLRDWRQGDEITISNLLPYARKIEVGKMKMRVPGTDHVYQQARKKVMSRYGNIANVQFTYRGFVGGVGVNPLNAPPALKRSMIVRGANGRFAAGTRTIRITGGEHNQSDMRYPILIITER